MTVGQWKQPYIFFSKLLKLDSPEIGSKEYQERQSCVFRGLVG